MTILTQLQVAKVQAHLAQAGMSDTLSEELLDHLCCAIEQRMDGGIPFDDALPETLQSWPIRHLQKLHRDVRFTTKIKPMIYRISAAVAILAGIALLSPLPRPVDAHHEEVMHQLEAEFDAPFFVFEPPTASPIAGVDMEDILTSGFGMRIHPLNKRRTLHRGIDLKAKIGTPVLATAAGRVVFAGEDGAYGITVRLLHEDGYITVYSHLSSHAVEKGDKVILGEVIAAVGNTGQSLGPHLHYEVLKDNVPVDPLALLD